VQAFKFLHRDHLPLLLRGQILLGGLLYYRLLERVYEDSWKGDAEEGRQVTDVNGTFDLSDSNDRGAVELKRLGVLLGSGSFHAQNVQLFGAIDRFIFACSVGDLAELVPEMTTSKDRYDACVGIRGVRCFADALWADGELEDGRAVRDVFSYPLSGRVAYDAKRHRLQDGTVPMPSPFRKRPFYERQREFRIVFKSRNDPIERDHVTINCASAAHLLEEIPLDLASHTGEVERAELSTRETALSVLRGALDRWNESEVIHLEQEPALRGVVHDPAKRREMMESSRRLQDKIREEFERNNRRDLIRAYFDLRGHGYRDRSIDNAIVGEFPIWILMRHVSRVLEEHEGTST